MDTVCGEMLCLHNKPAGKIKTEKGILWVCQQPSTCHFSCSEDKKHLYRRAVERFLSTNQPRPRCCGVAPEASKIGLVLDIRSPYFGRREPSPVRNYAKMKVVMKKDDSLARPFFVCSKKDDPCNYSAWGDECIIKRPLCKHGKPCELHTVKKEGPNYYRSFFCCPRPKNEDCKFSVWFDVFHPANARRRKLNTLQVQNECVREVLMLKTKQFYLVNKNILKLTRCKFQKFFIVTRIFTVKVFK